MSELKANEVQSEEASLQLHESGVTILYLSRHSSSPVTLSLPRMESIARLLKQVKEQRPAGLVIASEGDAGFCVGLDNKVKSSFASTLEAETLAMSGQALCSAIESLPFPTVAAISGACLAEGFEIALACSYRILSNDAQTCVGLPHVRLGVVPAFGTLGRLPKQLGLKRALELVLEGRILKPGEAFELQLVHELVAPQALLEHAVKIALGAKKLKRSRPPLHDSLLDRWGYLRKRLKAQTSASIKEHANGCMEASRVAMESMFSSHGKHGVAHPDRDAKEFGRLALANESKSLLRIAQLKDSARKLGSIAHKDVEHVSAVVLGAGNTGAGIAAALVASECGLILKDNKDSQLKRALHQIKKHVVSIAGLNEAEKSFLLNRIEATTRDSANFGNTNFAIEAVQEDKTVKIKALNELCESIPEESIIATSTSSFTISSLTSSLKRPSRIIGMRFFFPAETHELVEIVMGEHSGDRAIAVASALACKMGKCPVIVHDKPGALVNRIMNPYFREAFQLLQEGYSISDIDHCMQQFGFVMGPFRHLDVEGLDAAALWMDAIDIDEGAQASSLNYPKQLMALGRKGLKSGHGFYEYGRWGLRPSSDIREALHLDGAEHPIGKEQKTITERLLLSLLNQALKCLESGIAGIPGQEAINQIDLAITLGAGFPASKGGPIYYLDTIGAAHVLELLKGLEQKHGKRFKPAESLVEMASKKASFIVG